jgi:acetylornithine/succinyldiaminopimelate/putrescine aminotransferase
MLPVFDYLRQIRQWCDEKGILLILDEIQTGIGRTGKLFAFQHSSIEPDIMTLAKGMASGIPIGAIMAKNRASVFSFGEHGSTFGGNPLACAAALAVISYIINNNLCEHATSIGNMLAARLKDFEERFDLVQSSRGMGLLQALIFNQDVAADITLKCLEKGLLINKLKPNALRFMPSLVISDNELKQALDILEEVIGSF